MFTSQEQVSSYKIKTNPARAAAREPGACQVFLRNFLRVRLILICVWGGPGYNTQSIRPSDRAPPTARQGAVERMPPRTPPPAARRHRMAMLVIRMRLDILYTFYVHYRYARHRRRWQAAHCLARAWHAGTQRAARLGTHPVVHAGTRFVDARRCSALTGSTGKSTLGAGRYRSGAFSPCSAAVLQQAFCLLAG